MSNYTHHARVRMKEREITESEILECIQNYDVNHKDKKGEPRIPSNNFKWQRFRRREKN